MNAVDLYNKIFLLNVAKLSKNELAEFLRKTGIEFHEVFNSFDVKEGGFVYPVGTYHIDSMADSMVIGDSYFFKCSNIDGIQVVGGFQCPYWNEHEDHEGICNYEQISYESMTENHETVCYECPYHEDWENSVQEAEGDIINDSLMEILYFCIKEYLYSGFLFTPVHFTLGNYDGPEIDSEPYYCYNTDDKVAIAYKTNDINPIDFVRAIDAHNRIYYAYVGSLYSKERNDAAFKAYGISVLPSDYKEQVCTWLEQYGELRDNFYTDTPH